MQTYEFETKAQKKLNVPSTGSADISQHNIPRPGDGPVPGRHPEVEHQIRRNPATHKPGVADGRRSR